MPGDLDRTLVLAHAISNALTVIALMDNMEKVAAPAAAPINPHTAQWLRGGRRVKALRVGSEAPFATGAHAEERVYPLRQFLEGVEWSQPTRRLI